MEPFTGIYFDGHFYADVAEGGMTLLSEISFTATLNYVISDQSKLNTMFGGQLPVDILKREASLSVERVFTKLFEGGCSLDELKYKTATQASTVLQESNFSDWEGRAGVRLTGISDMVITLDPSTEKMLSNMAAMNSVPAPAPTASAPSGSWKCTCGAVSNGNFCPDCGSRKPVSAPLYQCDKCGWKPEDLHNPPNFCPECGDIFNENDAK